MATMLTASCGFTTLQPISSNLHTKLSSWPSSTVSLDLSHPVSAGLETLPNQKMTMKKTKKKDKDGQIWISNGTRWSASQWLESSAQVEVAVPLSVAWDLWFDKEGINRWMPGIHFIKESKDNPQISEWLLKYNTFGQDFEFKFTAKLLQPIYHQKIHWRSMDGLQSRGTVRFYPRGTSSVVVQLTISYEVPDVLAPLLASVSPFVESILQKGLDRFAIFAKDYSKNASPN